MARFVLALLAAVTISLTSVISAAPQDNVVGKVFFLEGGERKYLRESSAEGNMKEEAISGGDTAAAIAVLLGVPPPLMLSLASSSGVDSLLAPNPFNRPRTVVALTIKGVTSESSIEEILGSSSVQQRSLYANGFQRPHELSGEDVALQSLNHGDFSPGLDQGLESLASFLGGSYSKEEDMGDVVLKIPLPLADDFSISLNLEKRADWSFAEELLSLFGSTQSVSGQHGGQEIQAKLFLGSFSALELMEAGSDHRKDATKLFLLTAARVLGALEARYNGQMVGVFTLLSSARGMLPMFSIKESRSTRSLLDDVMAPSPSPASSNQSLYDAEVAKLMSRSLLLVTTLILLIATGLGSCFLLYMPLTRDTLLYANVKLD